MVAIAPSPEANSIDTVGDLREYQRQAITFAYGAGERWVYADAAGTGKTPTTAVWMTLVESEAPHLVVAPDAVCQQWVETIPNWTDLEPVDLRGTPEVRSKARQRLHKGSVGVLSYDLLRRDQEALAKQPWGAVAFDEAHRLKGRTNQTGTAAGRLHSKALVSITGTPLLNTAHELWMLLHLARPKAYTSFWRWARTHFYVEMTTHHGKLDRPVPDIIGLKPGHDEIIRDEAAGIMLWRDIDDLLPGLPPVTTHIVPVTLGEHERKLYDSIAKRGWGRHGDDVITTKNTVARMTRLRQITSDWNGVLSATQLGGMAAGAKVTACIEMIEGSTAQVVVLVSHKITARLIANRLPHTVTYTGDETKRERSNAVARFASGGAQVIVGTIAALGEGVDGLQVANRMVRLDRDWTPARNDQVVGRVRRSGQLADRIDVVDVVAEDTVDQTVAEALRDKRSVVDAIRG